MISEARLLTYGIALGAGLMYVLDPRQGGARRALIRDKSLRALHEVEDAAAVGSRDMAHRLEGAVARARGIAGKREDVVPGDVLVARVRAKLGHVCSHPHAIAVNAKGNGCIELKGPVLAKEAGEVLSAISRVPGVRLLDDDLERYAHPGDVPALQGPPARRPPLARLWTPATKLVLGASAAAMALASLVRGNPIGFVAAGGSVLALARSGTRGHGGHRMLREQAGTERVQGETQTSQPAPAAPASAM
ncbi:MAG: hypothetical protein JWP87_3796 [Labilithrix sp.]|nr:hypothetical protein [Labilithrix sp.]